MKKMDRRTFIKAVLAAPAIAAVGVVGTLGPEKEHDLPNALIVDPYLVNIGDIKNNISGSVKIIRLRKPAWGQGDAIKKVY